jgi:DNA mismatch repair protein MutH
MEYYSNKEDILNKAKEAEGKTFGEIDLYNRLTENKNKGNLGQIIEESFFGYQINSNPEADFKEAKVELKVTPYKINKNKSYSAKERLVLNIIDYNQEYKYEFFTSSFWKKNESLLLFFYLHDYDKSKEDMLITNTLLFEYPEEDLEIIKQDWSLIKQKILDGQAHEISESDTLFLGACSKGANKSSLRSQPFSSELAMQRAFCLKQSYMTQILRKYVFGDQTDEKIIKDVNELKINSLENLIITKLKPYFGKSQEELLDIFMLDTKAKQVNEVLLSRMLGLEGKISTTDEFKKANIIPKTIRIEKSGRIKESMSFPTFKYTEIINETWEESQLYELFETTKFMFVLFRFGHDNKLYFENVKFWRMPTQDLECLKEVWERTIQVIQNGDIVKRVLSNGNFMTNFPGKTDNPIGHVRPHAQNRLDTYPLPVMDKLTSLCHYTKHCFWLNNDYVLKQLY